MKPSKYQIEIYEAIETDSCNLMISAVAGSGKTTTLIGCADRVPINKSVAFLAFNNAIVNELKERVKRQNVHITTMHSLCWRAVMKHYNFQCELKPNKSVKYIVQVCKKYDIPEKKVNYHIYVFSTLIDLIRHDLAFEVEEIIQLAAKNSHLIGENEAKMLRDILNLMNQNQKEFDFTDMIYRAILDDVRLPKFDFVFVDESQDLSKLQQMIVSRIKSRRGRMVAVGDPHQAIYGFAGADVDSYNKLKGLFPDTKELPLSVNYRCGSRIIEQAKKLNPQILAYKGNGEGEVRNGFVDEIKDKDWVLCRNVKPLVLTNLYLLSKGIKSYVRGSDIGLGLIAIVNKAGSSNVKTVLAKYKASIIQERVRLIKLGVKNPDQTEKIDMMKQKLDILTVLSDGVLLTNNLIDKIKRIFKDQGTGVMLSTIHKAKGLENDTVFFLCPELIPSQYAEQPWEFQQEYNLEYVAITRAKSKLIYIEDYTTVLDTNKEILKKLEV